MKREDGFSLLELLIVVTVIGVIAALALPQLRKARQAARSASAIQSLRVITTAQNLYERKTKVFGTLAQLAPEGTIDPGIASGSKSMYAFTLALGVGGKSFQCTATPEEEPAVYTHYFVDETAVIRYEVGVPATAASPPIPK